jgi:hypothetical protein
MSKGDVLAWKDRHGCRETAMWCVLGSGLIVTTCTAHVGAIVAREKRPDSDCRVWSVEQNAPVSGEIAELALILGCTPDKESIRAAINEKTRSRTLCLSDLVMLLSIDREIIRDKFGCAHQVIWKTEVCRTDHTQLRAYCGPHYASYLLPKKFEDNAIVVHREMSAIYSVLSRKIQS